jgi:hypothetical protein
MPQQTTISEETLKLLQRPIEGQIHFSDVASEVGDQHQNIWWRKTDFDAELTINVESWGFPELIKVPIGLRPWLTPYGLVLVDDLVRARNKRLSKIDTANQSLHPDVQAELAKTSKAPLVLANYAPRDEKHTANNGSNFYLAITDADLEIYVTPVSALQDLEARNRIKALYEIPNKDHPEYNGEQEQFRSARVIRSRRHPEHLVPIFEYADREAIIAAKKAGLHPQTIAQDTRSGHIAFIDKFGNIKLETHNLSGFQEFKENAELVVSDGDREYKFSVKMAKDLRSAPLGVLAAYTNCSDHLDAGSNTGLVELVVRVNDNPSTSSDTAIFKLLEKIPNLDPASAEIRFTS